MYIAITIITIMYAIFFAAYLIPYDSYILDVVIALIVADISTAMFHWLEDAYFTYNINTPIISSIAKDNDMHHYRPRSITYFTWRENMQNNTIGSIFVGVITFAIVHLLQLKQRPVRLALMVAMCSITNLIHRFSHEKDCERNAFITFLQKIIFVDRETHKMHHSSEHHKKFGVFLKGANSIYDNLFVWRGLEALIYTLYGVRPDHKSFYVPDYDNDVILTDEQNCGKHSEEEVREWWENLRLYHSLR